MIRSSVVAILALGTSLVAQTPYQVSTRVEPDQFGPILNGSMLFVGSDPVHGYELWKTDGTPAGTVLVSDVYPGPNHGFTSRDPVALTYGGFQGYRVGGLVLFFAEDATTRQGLYRTDGTTTGTFKIADIPVDNPYGYPLSGGVVHGVLVFGGIQNGQWRVFRSDGTAAGTFVIANVRPSRATPFVLMDERIWFQTTDGVGWSDGTSAGTGWTFASGSFGFVGKDLLVSRRAGLTYSVVVSGRPNPPLATGFTYPPRHFAAHQGRTYFTGWTPALGEELYVTDGTPAGTRLVADLVPGPIGSDPIYLFSTPRGLLYVTRSGSVYLLDARSPTPVWIAHCPNARQPMNLGSRNTLIPWVSGIRSHTAGGVRTFAPGYVVTQMRWLNGLLLFDNLASTGSSKALMAIATDAAAQTVGPGCGDARLAVTDPVLGTTSQFSIESAQPGTGYLVLNPAATPPLWIGGNCEVFVSPGTAVVPLALGGGGRWQTSIAIPQNPALSGFPLLAQGVLASSGGGRVLDLTNAVELRFEPK